MTKLPNKTSVENALTKLEDILPKHYSMIRYSEAKLLSKSLPDLIGVFQLLVAFWDDSTDGIDDSAFPELQTKLISLSNTLSKEAND
jgi:hypothetical protein